MIFDRDPDSGPENDAPNLQVGLRLKLQAEVGEECVAMVGEMRRELSFADNSVLDSSRIQCREMLTDAVKQWRP